MDTTRMGFWCGLDKHHAFVYDLHYCFTSKSGDSTKVHIIVWRTMVAKHFMESRIFSLSLSLFRDGNDFTIACFSDSFAPSAKQTLFKLALVVGATLHALVMRRFFFECLFLVGELDIEKLLFKIASY